MSEYWKPVNLTRQDYLHTAQVKLAQAALYLHLAQDGRAENVRAMSHDVAQLLKTESAPVTA